MGDQLGIGSRGAEGAGEVPRRVSPEQVKLYVGYLRHKLDPAAPQTTPIETVRGFGYRYRRPS
jgi:DNA-binding response OmpR family regulator